MDEGLGLGPLLADLRQRGLPLGTVELGRLQRVLEMRPELLVDAESGRDDLRALLRCTLARSDDERAALDEAYDLWVEHAGWEIEGRRRRAATNPFRAHDPGGTVVRPPRPWNWRGAVAKGLATLAAVIFVLWLQPDDRPGPGGPPEVVAAPMQPQPIPGEAESDAGTSEEPPSAAGPISRFPDWIPHLRPIDRSPSPALLVVLALLCAGGAWAFRALSLSRPPGPAPDPDGGRRTPPPPTPRAEPVDAPFVPPEEVRSAVWNVEHFVDEEPTPRLDLRLTVDETAAAAGRPELRFQHAVHPRAVWLWRDTASDDPAGPRLVSELATLFTRSGLSVRTATFYREPSSIAWDDDGEVESAVALEGHRERTLLVALSDGSGLRAADENRASPSVVPCLRSLGSWPRHAWAELGGGEHGLAHTLEPFGIRRLDPCEVAGFLGGRPSAALPRSRGETFDLRVWAAALALGGEAFDEDTALAVRSELGLLVPAIAVRELLASAERVGPRWRLERRRETELADWLGRLERSAGPFSWLGHALAFWRRRYEGLLENAVDEDRAAVELEIARFDLWTDPKEASRQLVDLHERGWAASLRERLAGLRPSDRGGEGIRLPWCWGELDDATKMRLVRVGFVQGSSSLREHAVVSGPAALAVGALSGAAALLLVLSLRQDLHRPEIVDRVPTDTELAGVDFGSSERWAWAATDSRIASIEFEPGSDVEVSLTRDLAASNPEELRVGRIWRRGYDPIVKPALDPRRARRSLVAIEASSTNEVAPELAARLLDGGWVDAVFVGDDWRQGLTPLLGVREARSTEDQLVVVAPKNSMETWHWRHGIDAPGPLAWVEGSDLADLLALGDRSPGPVGVVAAWMDHQSWLSPRGAAPYIAFKKERTVELTWIPAGSFLMGSPPDEDGRHDNEGPQRSVEITRGFWMGRHEVTRALWLSVMGAPPQEANWRSGDAQTRLPATEVSWFEAVEFCNRLSERAGLEHAYVMSGDERRPDVHWNLDAPGYRLPTEAEWEYACRAGTATRFWSGDFNWDLDSVGWYSGNSNGRIQPAGEKTGPPEHPWGLLDIHGNTLEWCWDWWHRNWYQRPAEIQAVDPVGPANGSARAVRGGSFRLAQPGCRSAFRLGFDPRRCYDSVGFRVVLPDAAER